MVRTQDRILAIRRTGKIYDPSEYAEIVSAELVVAPDYVSDALNTEDGGLVIRRHRVTFRNETPISTSISWLDGELGSVAPLLLVTERLMQGTIGYIEERTKTYVTYGTEHVGANLATEHIARLLGIEVNSPILTGQNYIYSKNSGIVEFGEWWSLPNELAIYHYHIPVIVPNSAM